MGELKAAIKSIAFMFTSDLNKAEKWTAAHPALTVEEKVYREYMIKDMNGKDRMVFIYHHLERK